MINVYEVWDKGCNQSQADYSRAYLECKPLIGTEHDYKRECKQLRAMVRYMQNQMNLLGELVALYKKEG